MGCVSSKILAKSGSFQEKVSHSFQRSSVVEEIILSSSKSNGDQFLALLCTSNSSATAGKVKESEQSPAAAAEPAKIETINVSELLAGLEEENYAAEQGQERQDSREDGGKSPAQCAADSVAGPSRSFRTVEEFDALVTQSSSSERATAVAATTSSHGATAATTESSSSSGLEELAGQGEAEAAGAKRRARARQLGELKVPPAFDFSKSGSLRDWLHRGGHIFSPGSYVTPKFGTAPAPAEHGGHMTAEQQQHAVFDPELVAQFERAMEQLSDDEERVLNEILEALKLDAEEECTAALVRVSDQPVAVALQ
ncbi:uncharacterized protein LOC133898936 [Phragmites australis]|uniref:uncharacterized protein LOC133898936 n=1 Tax=Phragmites australis TaxID=29695 RepID=UPI002D771B29|nr:uncharacterized protein LOC133898936 [Phragmites australis]